MKTCVIYHSIDLDGWMSAAIVKHWFKSKYSQYIIAEYGKENIEFKNKFNKRREELPFIEFLGYNYGQSIPDLSEYDKVIMCDISFPIKEMEKLRQQLQDKFIWIDHHISAMKAVNERTNNYYDGLRDTKFAACELTWKYFFSNPIDKYGELEEQNPMPEIVRLLGRYDCFGHKGTDEETKVLEFQYGARNYITNYESAYRYLIRSLEQTVENTCPEDDIYKIGKHIYSFLCAEAKQTYKNGFEIEFIESTENYNRFQKFICINKERFNPINFGIDYHKDGYDGAACFHYANGMWNFSLYNDNGEVDCSQIAKQYGGGGHKGAAGFRINDINKIMK